MAIEKEKASFDNIENKVNVVINDTNVQRKHEDCKDTKTRIKAASKTPLSSKNIIKGKRTTKNILLSNDSNQRIATANKPSPITGKKRHHPVDKTSLVEILTDYLESNKENIDPQKVKGNDSFQKKRKYKDDKNKPSNYIPTEKELTTTTTTTITNTTTTNTKLLLPSTNKSAPLNNKKSKIVQQKTKKIKTCR